VAGRGRIIARAARSVGRGRHHRLPYHLLLTGEWRSGSAHPALGGAGITACPTICS